MMRALRTVAAALACVALPGCYATLHGNQMTSGGATATTTSSTVAGSAKFSNARVSFVSGQSVPANAPGGQIRYSGNASGWLVFGVVFAGLLDYVVGPAVKPLPPGTTIADTCSCYGYKPPLSADPGSGVGDQGSEREQIVAPPQPPAPSP